MPSLCLVKITCFKNWERPRVGATQVLSASVLPLSHAHNQLENAISSSFLVCVLYLVTQKIHLEFIVLIDIVLSNIHCLDTSLSSKLLLKCLQNFKYYLLSSCPVLLLATIGPLCWVGLKCQYHHTTDVKDCNCQAPVQDPVPTNTQVAQSPPKKKIVWLHMYTYI